MNVGVKRIKKFNFPTVQLFQHPSTVVISNYMICSSVCNKWSSLDCNPPTQSHIGCSWISFCYSFSLFFELTHERNTIHLNIFLHFHAKNDVWPFVLNVKQGLSVPTLHWIRTDTCCCSYRGWACPSLARFPSLFKHSSFKRC